MGRREGGREAWEDVVLMLSLCPWGFSVFGDSRCAMPLGTCAFWTCVCVCRGNCECGGCGIMVSSDSLGFVGMITVGGFLLVKWYGYNNIIVIIFIIL